VRWLGRGRGIRVGWGTFFAFLTALVGAKVVSHD
jgi:hypothetical protein